MSDDLAGDSGFAGARWTLQRQAYAGMLLQVSGKCIGYCIGISGNGCIEFLERWQWLPFQQLRDRWRDWLLLVHALRGWLLQPFS